MILKTSLTCFHAVRRPNHRFSPLTIQEQKPSLRANSRKIIHASQLRILIQRLMDPNEPVDKKLLLESRGFEEIADYYDQLPQGKTPKTQDATILHKVCNRLYAAFFRLNLDSAQNHQNYLILLPSDLRLVIVAQMANDPPPLPAKLLNFFSTNNKLTSFVLNHLPNYPVSPEYKNDDDDTEKLLHDAIVKIKLLYRNNLSKLFSLLTTSLEEGYIESLDYVVRIILDDVTGVDEKLFKFFLHHTVFNSNPTMRKIYETTEKIDSLDLYNLTDICAVKKFISLHILNDQQKTTFIFTPITSLLPNQFLFSFLFYHEAFGDFISYWSPTHLTPEQKSLISRKVIELYNLNFTRLPSSTAKYRWLKAQEHQINATSQHGPEVYIAWPEQFITTDAVLLNVPYDVGIDLHPLLKNNYYQKYFQKNKNLPVILRRHYQGQLIESALKEISKGELLFQWYAFPVLDVDQIAQHIAGHALPDFFVRLQAHYTQPLNSKFIIAHVPQLIANYIAARQKIILADSPEHDILNAYAEIVKQMQYGSDLHQAIEILQKLLLEPAKKNRMNFENLDNIDKADLTTATIMVMEAEAAWHPRVISAITSAVEPVANNAKKAITALQTGMETMIKHTKRLADEHSEPVKTAQLTCTNAFDSLLQNKPKGSRPTGETTVAPLTLISNYTPTLFSPSLREAEKYCPPSPGNTPSTPGPK